MFQNIKKGDVVKTLVGDDQEDIWCTVLGLHNDHAIQARVETTPDNGAVKRGQMIQIQYEDIFDKLEKGPCED